jgi:ribosomal-protein-alanine N-acetyltransferase
MNKSIEKLESERLALIPMNESFCSDTYLSWLNDSEVYKYLESAGDYKMDALREYIREAVKNNVFFWAICLKSSGKHIGNIKIEPISFRHKRGEYGILIGDKTEWGNGYAKEASKLIIDFCFKKLNLRKITLGVVESNYAAVFLYKNIGFEVEGIYKDHGLYENRVENVLRMAIFNQEFFNE